MQQRWLLLPKIKPASSLLRTSSYGFIAVRDCGGSIFILTGMFSASLVKKKKKLKKWINCFML